MPSGVSDYGAAVWLNTLFNISDPITGYWVALVNDEPGPAADGTIIAALEPVGGGYARQHYAADASHWASNGMSLTNLIEIGYPHPSTDWGQLSHYALCSAATDGQLYAWGAFTNPPNVVAGYAMSLPPGGLVITLSSLENSITT